MIYLRQFENHAAYEAAESGLTLPNVSLCIEEDEIHYKPYIDPYAGHDYVEIDGIKWATMNVGANDVTDSGLYFQWGDTQGYTADQVGSGEGQKYFGWADYKFNPSGDGSTFTKYNSSDGKTTLELSDDAARINMGGLWRTPTSEEINALLSATTSEWVTSYKSSNVNGMLFTSKTDSDVKLFFPAVGGCDNGASHYNNRYGNYWSATLHSGYPGNGVFLTFGSDNIRLNSKYRYYGYTIRGIIDV